MSGRILATRVMKPLSKLQKYQVLSAGQMRDLVAEVMRGAFASVEDVAYALYAYDISEGKEDVFFAVMNELNELKKEESIHGKNHVV